MRKIGKTPFSLSIVEPEAALCGRKEELKRLINYARDGEKVVLVSPRWYGKTTLAKKALHEIRSQDKNALTAYCSISRETTVAGVAERIASTVLKAIASKRSLLERLTKGLTAFRPVMTLGPEGPNWTVERAAGATGNQFLEEVIRSLANISKAPDVSICVGIDEFQTVACIDPKGGIEAMIRDLIQDMRVSFFFIGSQRHMLTSMFSDSGRPFYRMAHRMDLPPLSESEMIPYLIQLVKSAGGNISKDDAAFMSCLSHGIPFFLQQIGYVAFQGGAGQMDDKSIKEAFRQVMEVERNDMEAAISRLPLGQRAMLLALAYEPTDSPYSQEYMKRHGLTSAGAITSSLENLKKADFIIQEAKTYKILDPFQRIILTDGMERELLEARAGIHS